jgi:LysR family transcriptional regulator for bpeEF and oprC
MQIFKHVVALGSFSKAAQLLQQPKSRISRNIAALEAELGVQLIYRTTRQFRLTDAGKELYHRALAPLNELARAVESLNSGDQELSGTIRITAPEDLGTILLGDVCRAFLEIHPKVNIDLYLSNQVVDLVKDWIDVAIRIGRLKDSSLLQKKIGLVKTGLFVHPSLKQKYGPFHKIEDLQDIPYLAFVRGSVSQLKLRVFSGRVSKTLRLKARFSANNYLVLRNLAVQGFGLSVLPVFQVQEDLRQGRLVQVFSEWVTDDTPIQVVTPQQKEPPPRVKRFVEFVSSQLKPYFS